MPDFPIRIDLDAILGSEHSLLGRDFFPNLAAAVERITEAVHAQWSDYARGAPLPGGAVIHERTGEYLRSIMARQTGPYSGEVFSELPYADVIEQGAPARDMKKILNSSLKVRLTKDGRRYLIIPIRHGTPGSLQGNVMPQAVADWWRRGRAASSVTSVYLRPTTHFRDANGVTHGVHDLRTRERISVPGWRYQWGDRLGGPDLAGMGIAGQQARRLKGMVNLRNPGTTGGAAHSRYLSFRKIMEGSPGWIAPARPGLFPARATTDAVRPIAEEAFGQALATDIRSMLGS